MRQQPWIDRRLLLPLGVLAGVLVLLAGVVDDWSRDFTSHEAFIADGASDPSLRPLTSRRSLADLVEAVRRAAGRIRNLEYVGVASDETGARILFLRTHRILRLKSDVVIEVKDLGGRRIVRGEARSRLAIGDLGSNPRTLRRILAELRDVLEGSTRIPGESRDGRT